MLKRKMDEFELIKKYFVRENTRADVELGSGDDCAIVSPPPMQKMAITTDTLITGVHFPWNTSSYDIAYKALAVNLSDLAAMGATPAWVSMALTLPAVEEAWLAKFSEGFFALADKYNVQLIGGDLTHGTLSITITAQGFLKDYVTRSGAKPGDLIYVSNTLGDAGLALQLLTENKTVPPEILIRLNRPEPQIALGLQLPGFASSAIDISDGLAADLGHILEKSQVGAKVYVDKLPLSSAQTSIELALTAGDDYELCFTVPPAKAELVKTTGCPCTCIGIITDSRKLELQFTDGSEYHGRTQGYQHF
jgi:thiamine-monophosphate kinase